MPEPRGSEWIERRALLAWHEAAVARGLGDYDWRLVELGDALCSVSATDPSILINRVLGLGSDGLPSAAQLNEIRELYRTSGVGRFFLHVVPDRLGPGREALLEEAGYSRYRGWMKFARGPGAVREPGSELSVRKVGPEHGEDFAAIACPAFDLIEASQPIVAALIDEPRWHVYMSFDGAVPAGTGALYLEEGTGYLDWGATAPEFRRRGSQTAVLSARLHAAFDSGCTRVVTMTGEAVPGDPQHSYSNITRAGFTEDYLRENWIPAGS